MIGKRKALSLFVTVLVCSFILCVIAVGTGRLSLPYGFSGSLVLGSTDVITPLLSQVPDELKRQDTPLIAAFIRPSATPTSTPIPIASPTPSPMPFSITYVQGPVELIEGKNATFTWVVNGPSANCTVSTVYFGTTQKPGNLPDTMPPIESGYTDFVTDFMSGNYAVPMQFVGNAVIKNPGTYFSRAYAQIGGSHIWSEERTFVVQPAPRHTIRIIDPPEKMAPGNIAFSWDISGPATTTGFTTIVIGTESKPGTLNPDVSINQTPYTVLVPDFVNGSYSVPLRFIGNASITNRGTYYFRAIAFVNGKNIWSDEFHLVVD